ncbi:DNA-binding protein H-NS (fragment) [Paraburkholderia piptadeniae]|uniref:DNA-binding protein H-NS n=1 Tax=Paraburkholderia piptadeniae TaxID=1701573 RepID=A0A1N7RQY1_9BURK
MKRHSISPIIPLSPARIWLYNSATGAMERCIKKGEYMATLAAIERQIARLKSQANAMAKKQDGAVKKILKQMKVAGVTIEEIVGASRSRAKRAPMAGKHSTANGKPGKLPPKYRDPVSGATWSGHARPPAWIKDAKDRSNFLISKDTSAVSVQKAKATTALKGGKNKGSSSLRPKYQDPVSGATWSGAGRPPAWISQAKSRDAFLIGTTAKKAGRKSAAKPN